MISRPFSSRRPVELMARMRGGRESRTWRLVFCRSRPQARSFRQCAETLFRLLWGWRGLCSGSCVGFGSCITKVVAPSRQTPPRLSPQPQASGVPWRFPKIRGEGFDRSAFRWARWFPPQGHRFYSTLGKSGHRAASHQEAARPVSWGCLPIIPCVFPVYPNKSVGILFLGLEKNARRTYKWITRN